MTDFSELWPGGPRFAQAETMRLSTDSVLLADFARLRGGEKGIDLGCASGAIALLLLTREPRLHMTGLELDAEAAELARENMRVNALTERSQLVETILLQDIYILLRLSLNRGVCLIFAHYELPFG